MSLGVKNDYLRKNKFREYLGGNNKHLTLLCLLQGLCIKKFRTALDIFAEENHKSGNSMAKTSPLPRLYNNFGMKVNLGRLLTQANSWNKNRYQQLNHDEGVEKEILINMA